MTNQPKDTNMHSTDIENLHTRANAEAARAHRRARVLDAVVVLAAAGWTIDGQTLRAPDDFGPILLDEATS